MKKRSMLAIASLATGFVVAAITPSHGTGHPDQGALGDPRVSGSTLDGTGHVAGQEGPVAEDNAPGGQ
ncbi:hypothetical protein [Streptomyces sp. NPDC006739]|uniref:hypothetical protein n=1 Tax=Streptomyces sp. NPDC006739 TaxID=3364763 RepID=UPI0036932CCC